MIYNFVFFLFSRPLEGCQLTMHGTRHLFSFMTFAYDPTMIGSLEWSDHPSFFPLFFLSWFFIIFFSHSPHDLGYTSSNDHALRVFKGLSFNMERQVFFFPPLLSTIFYVFTFINMVLTCIHFRISSCSLIIKSDLIFIMPKVRYGTIGPHF